MKKKCVKKHQKLSENAKYYHFWFFWSKLQIQITNDLKLTILVVLWRACYREKAKKKSRCTKILSSETRTARIWIWIFALKIFFLSKPKNLVKTQQNKTKPIFLAVPLYNYHNGQYSRYSFASKRLFFFSENV